MRCPISRPATVRLVFPQWQGGYDETAYPGQIYAFGSSLLNFLAPKTSDPVLEVPVPAWHEGMEAPKEGGVFYRSMILQQMEAATALLAAHKPDRVITLGGDCLVSQAPFAYLNERYEGDLGILWIDAHPDITTPKDFDHAHAMVLGNLLGDGEPAMAAMVQRHVLPSQVLYAGVDNVLAHERATMDKLGLKAVPSASLMQDSSAILDWIAASHVTRLAIHLDLDVLDPAFFTSLLFVNPDVPDPIEAEHGKLRLAHVVRILQDVEAATQVVGLSIAEYMPWDALNLKKLFASLAIMH